MIHLIRIRFRAIAVLMSGLLVSTLVGGCFSEHRDATDPDGNCPVPASAIGSGKAVVRVRGYVFSPDTLRVAANTQVTWVNCDDLAGANDPHTTTSDTNLWDSPLALGQTYSRIFAGSGRFPYHCRPHPAMRAVILVQ